MWLDLFRNHTSVFLSQVVSGGQSSTLERLSIGGRMLSSCRASCATRPPSSLHPLLSFSALKSLTCLPFLPPSLPPSSSHPISLPHSPSPPHLTLSPPRYPYFPPFLLCPLHYPTSPTFPLTSLPFSLFSPPFLFSPSLTSPPSFHKMRLVVGW